MRRKRNFNEKCGHWRKLHNEQFLGFKKRILFVIFIAVSFYFTVYTLILSTPIFQWSGLFFIIGVFLIFSETVLLFDRFIARWFPWHKAVKKRIACLSGFSIIFYLLTKEVIPIIEPYFVKIIIQDPDTNKLAFMVGFLYLVIYVTLIIARNFHESLSFYVFENEKLKQDKLLSDYKALQDQLNPHFLFNNLSTLIAIIHTDKDKAIHFAENFTDVYRYVLTKEGQVAITVNDELTFLNAYTKLHIARIGEGLSVDINVDEDMRQKKVPHLSLQVLVENAIKHNVTSRQKPLKIRIGIDEGRLFVENNKQLKDATYSTKTGLSNLGKRLKILTDEEYRIVEDQNKYRVEIPLID